MTCVKMPENLYTKEIYAEAMLPGQYGWTVPWELYIDAKGCVWLNRKAIVRERPGGTVQLFVDRRRDGFSVDLRECDYEWEQRIRLDTGKCIPVIAIQSARRRGLGLR